MSRQNHKAPDNIVSLPSRRHMPPGHLEEPEQTLWRSMVKDYAIDGAASLEILATAMDARGRMRKCREAIDAEGSLVPDRYGNYKANPLLVAERGARDSYAKLLRILNLDMSGSAE